MHGYTKMARGGQQLAAGAIITGAQSGVSYKRIMKTDACFHPRYIMNEIKTTDDDRVEHFPIGKSRDDAHVMKEGAHTVLCLFSFKSQSNNNTVDPTCS